MKILGMYISKLRNKFRKERGRLFKEFYIDSKTKILDLGGGNGEYIRCLTKRKYWGNITVADIDTRLLEEAKASGLKIFQLKESDRLPFKDKSFDIVFCNSVLEHITVSKKDIWNYKDGEKFFEESFKKQTWFANEIRRIGNKYFIQTPNRFFPIESHTWFPFIQFFPRDIQIRLIRLLNKFWLKKTKPDWNLLSYKELRVLFPNAQIYKERVMGIVKSFMVIKAD